MINHVFHRRGESITADLYSAELHEMYRKLVRKHLAMVNRHGVLMLHDKAHPHIAQRTVQALHELQYETLPYPPYSPDLSPTDYHIFRHLDHFLARKTFPDDRAVQHAVEDFFASLTPDIFRYGIQSLAKRWQQRVAADGEYFD